MLLNEYKLTGENGRFGTHYEYAVKLGSDSYAVAISPGMKGIEIVEQYASRILGERVEFFLLQNSRFFAGIRPIGEYPLILDISLSKKEEGYYSVMAEITDNKQVLIELAGRMSPVENKFLDSKQR